jgi:hypothetical protein
MNEWRFDRIRSGRVMAQGIKVHADTESEALQKAQELLRIDGNRLSDTLRLDRNRHCLNDGTPCAPNGDGGCAACNFEHTQGIKP